MAGDWIKMEVALPDKPEVWQMAGMLSIESDAVIGKLLRVWAWFDSHTTDGVARHCKELIDKQAGINGFVDAMVSVGWMSSEEDTIKVIAFDKHNGKSAKTRIATNQRVAKHREGSRNGIETRQVLPRPIVETVKKRDGNTCVYCGRHEGQYIPPETSRDALIHIDHIIPVSQGGSDDIDNLACACGVCNLFKLDRTPDECGLDWPEIEGKRLGNTLRVTKSVTREEKRREEVNTTTPNGFAEFWSAYPKKVGKGDAEKAWKKHKPDLAKCLSSIALAKMSPDWTKDGGQYIPHPATWINGKRWEDSVEAASAELNPDELITLPGGRQMTRRAIEWERRLMS